MQAKTADTLNDLRKSIDAIDDEIAALLSKRMAVVKEVGHLKTKMNTTKSFVRAGREASMVRRLVDKMQGTLPAAAVCTMWRMIISSSLNLEQPMKVAVVSSQGKDSNYWLAREYFGSFIPISCHTTINQVISDVAKDKVSVGILPFPEEITSDSAWLTLGSNEQAARIFARLPFVNNASLEGTPLIAIAKTLPEKTGDDRTVIMVEATGEVSRNRIDSVFLKVGLKPEWLTRTEIELLETPRIYGMIVPDFVTENDERLEKALLQLGTAQVKFFVLGAYATPINVEK